MPGAGPPLTASFLPDLEAHARHPHTGRLPGSEDHSSPPIQSSQSYWVISLKAFVLILVMMHFPNDVSNSGRESRSGYQLPTGFRGQSLGVNPTGISPASSLPSPVSPALGLCSEPKGLLKQVSCFPLGRLWLLGGPADHFGGCAGLVPTHLVTVLLHGGE